MKSIIGSLGRRYGGSAFQSMRKAYYGAIDTVEQLITDSYVVRHRFREGTEESMLKDKYYGGAPIENVPEGIICFYDGRIHHGGPTDRLRGLLSTYREARRRGLSFFVHWSSPFALTDYLEPAEIDWRIAPEQISYNLEQSYPVVIQDLSNGKSMRRLKASLVRKLKQYHVYSNSDDAIGHYRELYAELFRPSPMLKAAFDEHQRKLGENYVAFSFRFLQLLGDFVDWYPEPLAKEQAEALMEKVKGEFHLLASKVPESSRILVTSDSCRFLNYIRNCDPRIYIVEGQPAHMDLQRGESGDKWLKVFVDQQLLMGAREVTLMRTGAMYKSGFPRFAAEVGGAKFIYHEF